MKPPSVLSVIVFCFISLLAGPMEVLYCFNLEVETGVSFDSNVFRTPESPARDYFLTFVPALYVQYFSYRTSLRLDSRFMSERYRKFSEVNSHQIALSGQAGYNLSNHLSLGINDELKDVQNIRQPTVGGVATPFSYISNQISPFLKYERPSGMRITIEYFNELMDYKDSSYAWQTDGATLSFSYPLGHKTTAQLLFGLKRRVFETFEADISYLSKFTGAEVFRKLSSKFNANVHLGWEGRTYADPNQNIRFIPIDIYITGKLFRKILITLGFRRILTDSDVYIGQALIPVDTVSTLSWDLTPKIRLKVESVIGRNIYLGFKRSDFRFSGKLQVGYRMTTWGTFYLTYEYELMKSQEEEEEYYQNQLGISFVCPVPFLR